MCKTYVCEKKAVKPPGASTAFSILFLMWQKDFSTFPSKEYHCVENVDNWSTKVDFS